MNNKTSIDVHPIVGQTIINKQRHIKQEMGEILAGLAALEALTDAARHENECSTLSEALYFVTQHMYGHANAVIECYEDFDARFHVIKQ